MAPRYSIRLLAATLLMGLAVMPAQAAVAPSATITLEFDSDTPNPFRLSAPSPNPFSSQTRLTLTVDEATTMTVAVHDALGRRVALLHDGTVSAGTYSLRVEADNLPPGLYLVRATNGRGQTATRSVSLVR
ncbi:T9SS type A sorting domain-containing protein [Rubrivirga sp.]|uniref:T9SS type A sorting domain-containing protein n=1 Tax=Rubrivirga sp. TaxID=1885344 RepID=UPI003C70C24A